MHRLLPLGIDDSTGSPSGRTRGRDACTSTPERSHSASLLCVPGSAREPRRRRTSGARRGAASARLQATRSVKVPVRKPITLSGALAGGEWWPRLTEGDRRGIPVLAELVPRLPLFPKDPLAVSFSLGTLCSVVTRAVRLVGVAAALGAVHAELRRVVLRSEGRTRAHHRERPSGDECHNQFAHNFPPFQDSTVLVPGGPVRDTEGGRPPVFKWSPASFSPSEGAMRAVCSSLGGDTGSLAASGKGWLKVLRPVARPVRSWACCPMRSVSHDTLLG